MRWRGRRTSANIEDRRGGRGAVRTGGGFGVGMLLLIAASIFFPDAVPFLKMFGLGQPGAGTGTIASGPGKDDEVKEFISVTLADTEEIWNDAFRGRYREPTLVLFDGATRSPCGTASAQSGPFYCPADEKIYIDPAFFRVMADRMNARGDFAQAYVIAHEVAHHVQNMTGRLKEVNSMRARRSQIENNRATVRLELQADCYAGIWARRAQDKFGSLERGDIQEALGAAHAVGDDVLQRMSGQRVDERRFTHGTAEQRQQWFATGLETDDPNACNTFDMPYERL